MGKVKTSCLGLPRIGKKRELKFAIEKYWREEITKQELLAVSANIKKNNWQTQKNLGIDLISSNDFSFYDQILDTTLLLGNIPTRFNTKLDDIDLQFQIARGDAQNPECYASDMTKWFDTNYHYIVPEFGPDTHFSIHSTKIFDEYVEAKILGIETKPILIGPFSYLKLGKETSTSFNKWELVQEIATVYKEILSKLRSLGVEWIQIDEPFLGAELNQSEILHFKKIYSDLTSTVNRPKIILASYFSPLAENASLLKAIDVEAIQIDAVSSPADAIEIKNFLPAHTVLSIGIINGRNIWVTEYQKNIDYLTQFSDLISTDRLWISISCSLLHVPYTVVGETISVKEINLWLSFAEEKLRELKFLADYLNGQRRPQELEFNQILHKCRKDSKLTTKVNIQHALSSLTESDFNRKSPFEKRYQEQKAFLKLPRYCTTSIGSFPQTKEVRRLRSELTNAIINTEEYNRLIKKQIDHVIELQNEIGLDVLVHGEFERTDMVEYFADHLVGFATSRNGWVQSYGTRCIKPPVIYGDVERSRNITVEWTKYAQQLTAKKVKGMLTGPVTILRWSFPREDYPAEKTALQIGLAIRDEVLALEDAGISIIQVDEPAYREGAPIRHRQWDDYFKWAVAAFKLATSAVKDQTQIHTHMCYSSFNDILGPITQLDADVITIETSRSHHELLDGLKDFPYPNAIGPGVYDVHSPAIPSIESIKSIIQASSRVISPERIWVNPDCGLKTRGWEEVIPSLKNMVQACRELRLQD